MTLIEYIDQCKKDLDDFEQIWVSKNKKYPDNWPLSLSKSEWDEQFILTCVNNSREE